MYVKDIPDFVIRPSGVWNSRAPIFNYRLGHGRIQQAYGVAGLAFDRMRIEATVSPPESVRALFRVGWCQRHTQSTQYFWRMLRDATPGREPSVNAAVTQLSTALEAFAEIALLKLSSLFETFIQCWALNFLLGKLETGDAWTIAERRLAQRFWPLGSSGTIPSFPQILHAIPSVQEWLTCLPHITRRLTGEDVDEPIDSTLTALSVLLFWRAYRNLVVHSQGRVSNAFLRRHGVVAESLRRYFPHVPELRSGRRLIYTRPVVVAAATTHYKAAVFLSEQLVTLSGNRRGHGVVLTELVGPISEDEERQKTPPLLTAGDHEASVRWLTDTVYREQVHSLLFPSPLHPTNSGA